MAKITKTLGPIHFEDLDPHRFEDLVRELVYDFKEWQNIEATGRGGADDGFDIRAWEKPEQTEVPVDEEEEQQETVSKQIEGNVWMVQCKREKEIGPAKVAKIIQESIDEKNPPYGYILVAPVDFSKKSHDAFREELRKKGVTEFHLWGKGILEDMLHMPKNDRILFAFFGISLAVRRRSRKTEIRFGMNNKNKLLKILGGGNHSQDLHESVLVRDFNDNNYPFKAEYEDFDKNPRWREQIVTGFHPLGVFIRLRKFYGYIDKEKKEFDFVRDVDLTIRTSEREKQQEDYKKESIINDYWRHIPRKNQVHVEVEVLLFFEDILVIDDKGDILYNFPHIYSDYKYDGAPFRWRWHKLTTQYESIDIEDNDFKKVDFFPKTIPESPKGKVHLDKFIEPDADEIVMYQHGNVQQLFSVDGKYDFLEQRDKIQVKGTEKAAEYRNPAEPMVGVEIMSKYDVNVKKYFEKSIPSLREHVEKKVGRKLKDSENLTVLEIEKVGYWVFQDAEIGGSK